MQGYSLLALTIYSIKIKQKNVHEVFFKLFFKKV